MNGTVNRLSPDEIKRLRSEDFSANSGFVKAESVLSAEAGEPGSAEREEFEAKARAWYYGEILRERRKESLLPSTRHAPALSSVRAVAK